MKPSNVSNLFPPALLALALALVGTLAGGCADEEPRIDVDVDVPCDEEPPTEEPPQPYGCVVGETENWGEGIVPSIAGSDEGYAVLYAEWHDQAGMIRMVSPDGEPTSPLQNLPIDQYDVYAQVTNGLNGYLVNGADIGIYGGMDRRSIYTLDQSGEILRSYGSYEGLWGFGLASGALDWTVTTYGTQAGEWCPTGMMAQVAGTGPAGTIAKVAPYICLHEQGYTSSWLTLGFGARGEGFALGLHHYLTTTGPDNQPMVSRQRLQVVVYDGNVNRRVDLHVLDGVGGQGISRIVATDDGYAVRWGFGKYRNDNGQTVYEEETYLTFLRPDGDIVRTARIPSRLGDIAWNGREIGEVTYDDIAQALLFTRYGKDGLVIETTSVTVTSLHYMSSPKIASANGHFAVVWGDNDYVINPRPELHFTPIACR